MDEFERELQQALERRPAPPGLKRRIMEARNARRERRSWFRSVFAFPHAGMWMKVAATVLIAAAVGGGVEWHAKQVQEQREGEAARQQVMTALRITGHALNEVQTKLAAHDREGE